jgi:hypothetical protein
MAKVFVVTKDENKKVEIFPVYQNLQDALNKIDNDFNTKYYPQKNYEFNFNQDTINKAFNAIESFHIVVHPDYPYYHIWRRDLV